VTTVAWVVVVEVQKWPAIGVSGATRSRTSCIPIAIAIVVADAAVDCTIASSAAWDGRRLRRQRRRLQQQQRDGGCR